MPRRWNWVPPPQVVGGIVFITTPIWSLWVSPPELVLPQEYSKT
nr:MAG TPA: hypothetical protein [Caudoviricetes sp.]